MAFLLDFIGLALALFIFIVYFKKVSRRRIYDKYKYFEDLNKKELDFYHDLKAVLPRHYHVISKVDIQDIIKIVKVKRYLECVEVLNNLNKLKNNDVDFAILDNNYRFVCAVNISKALPEGQVEIPTTDSQVEMFLNQLDLKCFKFEFSEEYDLESIHDYIEVR